MRLDELVRAQVCERRVEGQDECAVETGRSQQAQLRRFIGQPEQRLAGHEKRARMRLEGQHGRRLAERSSSLLRHRNYRAMPAMDTVEVTHCDDGAVQGRIGRAVAHDHKLFACH